MRHFHGWVILAVAAAIGGAFEDGFDGDKLADGWTWMREHAGYWRLRDGGLEIRVEPGKADTVRNALIRDAPDRGARPWIVEVTVSNLAPLTAQYEQAGITWYVDDKPVFKLVKERIDGATFVIPGRKPIPDAAVRLRLTVSADAWLAEYQPNAEGPFQEAGRGKLPPPGRDQVSLQCYNGPPDGENWFRFDNLRIAPAE